MPSVRHEPPVNTATAVLDIAERLVQRRGFNGFSYADIAAELGITKASLHYHFVSKAELGTKLIARYSSRFGEALAGIDAAAATPADKLRSYCEIYTAVLAQRRMCLCGMLAAEYDTLPDPMREGVNAFFDQNQSWLAGLLDDAASTGSLTFSGTSREAARRIIATLEGGMLISRPCHDTNLLEGITDRLIAEHTHGGPGTSD
jgi:TetR/AcrR family transcriptional regulator, transcriptional repressor for nem operon